MITEEKRKIKRIELFTTNREELQWYVVDPRGCDEIKPYYENGEMAGVLWFEIIKDSIVIARVNGKYVSVVDY